MFVLVKKLTVIYPEICKLPIYHNLTTKNHRHNTLIVSVSIPQGLVFNKYFGEQ